MDQSGIAAYSDRPLPDLTWTYELSADEFSVEIADENGATIFLWRYANP
jgi:hypothetical protein